MCRLHATRMHSGNYRKRSSFYRFLQLPVNSQLISEFGNHVPSQFQLAYKSVIRIKFLTQLIRIRTNKKLIEQC